MRLHQQTLAVVAAMLLVGLCPPGLLAQETIPSADEPPSSLKVDRPPINVDFFIALYGGMAFPTKTNAQVDSASRNDHFTVIDQAFSSSKSLGGKIGVWVPTLRERTGLDFGYAIDVTNYQPDIKSGRFKATGIANGAPVSAVTWADKINVDSTLYTLNLLFRVPLYVSAEYPNGRVYPYGGGGVGIQNTSFGTQGRAPRDFGTQALAGLNLFLTPHIAMFGEYKFTNVKQTLGFATSDEKYTFAVHHAVFGLAYHFGR